MNFTDLRERVIEFLKGLWDRIEQSPYYNNLRERYEVLPSRTQQMIQYGGVIALGLFLIYLPLSFMLSASSRIGEFEETRTLLRNLLRTANMEDLSQLARSVGPDQAKSSIDALLVEAQIPTEQITGIEPSPGETTLVPKDVKNVIQQGVTVRLKKLNVTQIQDVGFRLQNLMPQDLKMTSLEISRNREEKNPYFDVEFQLVNFSIPPSVSEEPEAPPEGTKRGKAPRRPKGGA